MVFSQAAALELIDSLASEWSFVPSIPATISYLWVSIGFAISVSVGLFFGFYPAKVAANLDPIDCLCYE